MLLSLQTSTFSVYGGIPTYNRLVCRALNEFGGVKDKYVLLATDNPSDIEPRTAELSGLQLEAYAGNRLAFVRRILNLAMNRRIDLALIGHVNYAPLGLLLRRFQPQMRYGVLMYGVDVWTSLSRHRRNALSQADFTVSISEYTKNRAVEVNGAVASRVHLLPNALEWSIEESNAAAMSVDESTLRKLSSPSGTRLLTVCRLDSTERYKGVDTIIEALPAVLAQVPDVQHLIVGSGGDTERLKALAARLGVSERVHFLGSVDDAALQNYYRTSDVFVMPSAKEGFGFVFLEAMRYGKPVVAANSGGSPEVVLDGETGVFVPYGDISKLAEALTSLCLNPQLRARLGQAGYRRVREKFTFPRFKQTLTDILMQELPASSIYRSRRNLLAESFSVV